MKLKILTNNYMIHPLWYLCIYVRLFIALNLSKYSKYYNYIKLIILIISLGFAYKALTGSNNEFQIAKVFWHKTRLVHSFFFFIAYLMADLKNSTLILLIDVIFSIIYRFYIEILYRNK